jgi:hypothetical protein
MAEIYDLNSGELKNGGVAEKSKDNQYIIPPCTPEEWETIVPTENDFKNVKHANKKNLAEMSEEDILFEAKTKRYRKNFAQRHRSVYEEHETNGTLDQLPIDNMFHPQTTGAPIPAKQGTSLGIVMRPQLAVNMMKVDIPIAVINEINEHIEQTLIPEDKDFSKNLVGQINRSKKSKQLEFPHKNSDAGEMLGGLIQTLGDTYMGNVRKGECYKTEMDSMWTVHSYEGDYNPLHDHGTKTPIGLSCILYLKVPDQIAALPNPAEEFGGLNGSSGAVDGFTYFNWGTHGVSDYNMLRSATEEYVKPEVGTLLMFPSWLRHSVNPFFGEGERRTLSANLNVYKFEELEDKI